MIAKPPIGLKPRFIHESQRRVEVKAAIMRYLVADKSVPIEWVTEYNELAKKEDDE